MSHYFSLFPQPSQNFEPGLLAIPHLEHLESLLTCPPSRTISPIFLISSHLIVVFVPSFFVITRTMPDCPGWIPISFTTPILLVSESYTESPVTELNV